MRFLPELVYREETLDLSQDGLDVRKEATNLPASLRVQFVFDWQVPRMSHPGGQESHRSAVLGLQRKPSYWDLPVELQSLLLERQLAVSNEFLGLRVKFTSETGSRGVRSAVGAVRAARLVPVSAARHTADRPSLGVSALAHESRPDLRFQGCRELASS